MSLFHGKSINKSVGMHLEQSTEKQKKLNIEIHHRTKKFKRCILKPVQELLSKFLVNFLRHFSTEFALLQARRKIKRLIRIRTNVSCLELFCHIGFVLNSWYAFHSQLQPKHLKYTCTCFQLLINFDKKRANENLLDKSTTLPWKWIFFISSNYGCHLTLLRPN